MADKETGYVGGAAKHTMGPLAGALLAGAGEHTSVYPDNQKPRGRIAMALQAIIMEASDEGANDELLLDAMAEAVASCVAQTSAPQAAFADLMHTAAVMTTKLVAAGVAAKPRSKH